MIKIVVPHLLLIELWWWPFLWIRMVPLLILSQDNSSTYFIIGALSSQFLSIVRAKEAVTAQIIPLRLLLSVIHQRIQMLQMLIVQFRLATHLVFVHLKDLFVYFKAALTKSKWRLFIMLLGIILMKAWNVFWKAQQLIPFFLF